jgi:excisionase family DNA binding protein
MRPSSRLPRLLSVDEVARQLDVSTRTIRRWLLADYLSCHRLGRQIRIAEDELAAFIRNSRERSGR